jgi:putative ABC transport system permease protein
MGSVRWHKVARDFAAYRARTILVVASIAVGVFAIGTIAGANALLDESLGTAYAASRAANATFYAATGFDRELVDTVRRMPGVAEAEGRRSVVVRLESGAGPAGQGAAGGGGPTRDLQLTALPDFDDQRIDVVHGTTGRFPPRRGEIVFERSSLRLLDLREGEVVTIRTTGGDAHELRVAGFAQEPGASPAYYFGRLNGYVTFDTLADLGWSDSFDELRIRAADPTADRASVRQLADEVRLRIERAGTAVTFAVLAEPGRHPADELVGAVFLVLGAIGFLSLFVAAFLIVNTISVLMAQQTRQIGLMKVVGGQAGQIAAIYLGLVAAYALVALAIAIPLAALAALGLASLAAGLLNVDVSRQLVPPWVIGLQVAAGLGVPLLAALIPVRRGVRISVHDAITDIGIGEHFGRGWVDRLLGRLRALPRPMLLSIRSTFRRKGRLVLTLAALTLGGAVFMTIFTVRGSLFATLGDTVRYFDYDVQVELSEPVRAEAVVAEVMRLPGVVAAEPWRFASTLRIRPDGSESASLVTFGLPGDTQTVEPIVQAGRWLLPGEGNALVVTANLLRDEPDLRIGDAVTLRVVGRDSEWVLVGIVQSPTMAPFLYVDAAALERVGGDRGRAGMVMVKTEEHDPAAQAAAARALREGLEAAGISVAATTTTTDVMNTIYTVFDTLVVIVSVMAVLLGVVGGLGLAGTMTMNVVERSREIGVIRTIGATDSAVRLIFIGEGVVVGLMAWFAGVVVSLPLSRVLSDALGDVFVQRPLAFSPSLAGAALWLVVVLALSVLGSIVPAWRASRIAVREVLAYE